MFSAFNFLKIGGFLLVGFLAWFAVKHYIDTNNARIESYTAQIVALNQANIQLEENFNRVVEANEAMARSFDELQREHEIQRTEFIRVQTEFQEIRAHNNELRQRLGRHEIDALAAARPQLVENIINNASRNALRCFELLSGSPLNEREQNATTAREFNSECPWIWETLK